MNKKNKNKNRSKPSNPVPPSQNVESTPVIEETITVLAEENPLSLVAESDSVIETKSEVTEPGQDNDVPTDTPKKPKRNKGKKKKQEETSAEDNITTLTEDSAPLAPLISDNEVKVIPDSAVEIQENKTDKEDKNTENVSANVRKKKNKKKINDQQQVEELPQAVDSVKKSEAVLVQEVSTIDETIIDDLTTKDFDVKPAKKKNKKKKHRSDSEKSDKVDDTVICTAAFQKLITPAESKGDIISEPNKESSKDSGKEEKIASTIDKEETLKDLIQSVLLAEESKDLDDEPSKHDQSTESKSKKKGKKDKKQPQTKKDTEKPSALEEQNKQQELVEITDIAQQLPSETQAECQLSEAIPKAKAKIAKPVEKKRKGKLEPIGDAENKLEENIIIAELEIKEFPIEIEKSQENISASVIHLENTNQTTNVQEVIQNEPNILIADESGNISSVMIKTPTLTSDLNLSDVNIGIKSSEEIVEPSMKTPDPVVLEPAKEPEKLSEQPFISVNVSEIKKDDSPISSEPYKTVEKKKKKHPKKIDVHAEKMPDNKVLVTPESELIKEETTSKHQDDIPAKVSTPADIEISSLKTDVLDSSSDATPDFIHHPLATSQQLIDDNNNMIIREITVADEKLSPSLLIPIEPIIQDSGETPEPAVEKILIESPTFTEVRQKSVEPEKTDLKSKMMEVNQDMEELRLSIERSLAELTSMERSEQDVVIHSEEIEASKLVIIEPKSCSMKDERSELNKSVNKNILAETVVQETQAKSEILTKTMIHEIKKRESPLKHDIPTENVEDKNVDIPAPAKLDEQEHTEVKDTQPQAPARKEHKGKGKGKRKGKQEVQSQQSTTVSSTTSQSVTESASKEVKQEKEQSEQKSQSESNKNKGKQQQALQFENDYNEAVQESNDLTSNTIESTFEPIENFEDALTSSVDDVNKTFELIANEVNNSPEFTLQNPKINITSPTDDTDTEPAKQKENPVSPPKNLLGHPDIPVPSSRTDYKKEKNKPPNMRQAQIKIKDAVDIEKPEKNKQSKESQTENKRKLSNNKNVLESFSYMTNGNAEYIYKYSFRKVFLQSLCHVCRKALGPRVPCQFCALVFYCSQKHKDEDWPQHQSLCFAICTIAHLKGQKHIYADAKNITGQSYRLLRMQMIISCEKVLKRKLVPWEQEALLYPRVCADTACREWQQSKLADCEGCGQLSYCSEHPSHLSASHQRWCRSYALYQKLVHHQQTRGRLEPRLPTAAAPDGYTIPDNINELLAAMYDEKIDMTDVDYAALTQLATAPLTTAYCLQLATTNHSNGISKKSSLVVHVVGGELHVEADVLFKWERFLLHAAPRAELRVVLLGADLNPTQLPLQLLEKVKVCESCTENNRRVVFSFQDKKTYHEYWASDEYCAPDIVCAFNQSIQRSSMHNGKDTWPTTISCILKLKTPLVVSAYSIEELHRDVARIKECAELSGVPFKVISEPKCNPYASVRPDRNFITDDEIPLLFKNYCFTVLCGV